ncbi:unnamed protein product [Urochloa decumbens]|uniref:Cytochrome P450 n=1 Tax=Urochloa decumbens TaxID=240449 RepID=A0ABC9B206_9POAL
MEQFGMPAFSYYYAFWPLLALLVHAILRAGKKPGPSLPPGPCQLPLIGSFHHLLRGLPHHTMRHLSLRHGPLMLLKICERVAVVASSADAAREIFHDAALEQRPSSPALDEQYSRYGMGIIFAPYGDHWRLVRRVLVAELLAARRVDSFRRIREDEAARLVSSLASPPRGQLVNVDERLEEFVADSAVRAMFGDRLPDRAAFLKMLKQALDLSSVFDLRDLFPSSRLAWMLPRNRKAERNRREAVRLMDDILRLHEERRTAGDGDRERDMIDVLLRIQKEGAMGLSLTHGVIRAVLMDVFIAALDTTASTLQWAMAELVANPRVKEKAQLEIRRALAGQDRVHEAALVDLHYLKAVIRETLRLHPVSPLIPRVCLDDRKILGYDVPKGTIVVTNVWAISRDPKYWEDPEKFMPERFQGEDSTVKARGLEFGFMPFGGGRRMCPGISFAQINIEIALASLLYHFDWELPNGVKPEEVDMSELFGITVRRNAALLLRPIPHVLPVVK